MASLRVNLTKMLIAVFVIVSLLPTNGVAFASSNKGDKHADTQSIDSINVENIAAINNENLLDVTKEILVKYKDKTKKEEVREKLKKSLKNKELKSVKELSNSQFDLMELYGNEDVTSLIEQLGQDPYVEYAQPNYILELLDKPQENVSVQEDVYSTTEVITGVDVNILKAWELTEGSSDIVVGVLDTGIDIGHTDLSNNIYVNQNEIPNNGIDDDKNGYIDDINGWDFINNDGSVYDSENEVHGTHISGIIAAEKNGRGVVGIAPSVKILPLKFINGSIGYTSEVISGIEYAKSLGVQIINCSWGSSEYNLALKDVMQNSDVLFVCAAGNNGTTDDVYPAAYDLPNIISVAAVDNNGVLASFSNYGDKVHVVAPGVSIYSSLPEESYDYKSGTSMAAPFVTGVAALIKSYKDKASYGDIISSIVNGVVIKEELEGQIASSGILDAYNSLKKVKVSPEKEGKSVGKTSTIPNRILKILKSSSKYSEIKEKDKKELCEYFQISDEIMRELEAKGHVLSKSINIAVMTVEYDVSIEYIEKLMAIYNKTSAIERELSKLLFVKQSESLSEEAIEEFKELLTKGYKVEYIRPAYIASKALGVKISELINDGEDVKDILGHLYDLYSGEDVAVILELSKIYNIKISWFLDFIRESDLTLEEIQKKIQNENAGPNGIVEITSTEEEEVKFDKYNSAPFSYKENSSESISINNGSLTTESVDLSLPGRNGLDLNIVTRYDSSNANLYHTYPSVSYTTNYTYTYYVYGDMVRHEYIWGVYEDTYLVKNHELLGIYSDEMSAWQRELDWEILSIADQPIYDSDGNQIGTYDETYIAETYVVVTSSTTTQRSNNISATTYNEIHNKLGSGWSFGFSSIEYESGKKYLHLPNGASYEYYKTSVVGDSNLKDYTLNDMILEDDTSYSYNGITSAYSLSYKDGKKEYFASDGRILAIKDRFNENIIRFEHTSIDGHYVINKITDTLGRVINILYENTTTGKKVTIKLPDNSTIEYILEPIPNYPNDYMLVEKKDLLGRRTTYNYDINVGYFDYFSKSYRNSANVFANLKEVHYPTTAYTKYSYEKAIGNLGNQGSLEYYRIKTREEINNTVSYNKQTYDYTKDYTGYSYCSDPSNLPSDYKYYVTITDNVDNNKVTYTFNNKHLKEKEEVKDVNSVLLSTNDYNYDANRLPTKVVSKVYKKGTTDTYVKSVENYSYDSANYGDLIGYWDAQTKRDELTNEPLDNEHKTTIQYDSTYHIITLKEYKKDENTTIREKYTLTTDKKTVELAEVYEQTGSLAEKLKSKTQYVYDNYGNVTEIRNYLEDNNWASYISSFYSYQDNVTSRSGQFNGAYLTRKWVEGVKDADGKLLKDKQGNYTGTIDEEFEFNWYGQLEKKYDKNGNYTTYVYDKLGRIIQIILPDNQNKSKSWNYNDTNNTVEFTDENGNKKKYYYDSIGNLVTESIYDPQKGFVDVRKYEYDLKCRIHYENDLISGSRTEHVYYNDGRLNYKEIVDTKNSNKKMYKEVYAYEDAYQDGSTGELYFKETKKVEGDINSPSITTVVLSNKLGQIVKQSRLHYEDNILNEYADTFKYDYLGNKTQEKIARANTEGWKVPSTGQPYEYTAKYEYNFAGEVIKKTDIYGNFISTVYDSLGRVKSVTDMKSNKLPEAERYSTTFEYDNLGRVIIEKMPFEKVVSGTTTTIYYTTKKHYYNRNGNIVCEKISSNKPGETESFNKTEYEYNRRNLLTKVVTYKDGNTVENYTQYYYDALGNKVRMYTGLKNSLTINGLDNILTNGDNSFSVTKYDYNHLNLLEKMTDPIGQQESYQYDLNGNLKVKLDRNGNTTLFSYDALNRLTNRKVTNKNNGNLGEYSYDYTLTGNKLLMTGGGTRTDYKYDDLGRLVNETESFASFKLIKEYSYDASNNRKSFVLKKSTGASDEVIIKTTYAYDYMDRLQFVYDENGSEVAQYKYNDNGNRESLKYKQSTSDIVSTSYQYNLANKLVLLANTGVNNNILSKYEYTYYSDGNQASKSDIVFSKSTEYVYDGLGRLTVEKELQSGVETALTTYTYDDYNNRKTMTASVGETTVTKYLYDKNNRLRTEIKEVGEMQERTRYVYDGNGNQTLKSKEIQKMTQASGIETIGFYVADQNEERKITISRYDGFNQLVRVESGNQTIQYTYNGNGLRATKSVDGIVTTHAWDGQQIVAELNGTGTVTSKYIRGINLIYTKDAMDNKKYYLFNGHGDVVRLTDSSGNVIKNYEYDAFGVEKNIDPSDTNPFRYCGEYWDSETGAIYLRARYYNPAIGRFISEDSYLGKDNDPISLNLYTYCWNNPVNYFDPTGNDGIDIREMITNWFFGLFNRGTGKKSPYNTQIDRSPNGSLTMSRFKDANELAYYLGEKSYDNLKDVQQVIDVSVSFKDWTVGYSYVYHEVNDFEGHYVHVGKGKSLSLVSIPVSVGVGYGFVFNAEKPEDYAGNFIDVSGNMFIGVDGCTWPEGASAMMFTINTNPSVGARGDNYILFKDSEGFRLYASTNIPKTDIQITYDSRANRSGGE